ncbi:ATP-binding cassette sub-family C member 3-like [Dermacentor silvarum]|uniref:ATP-binding cassette sub-family C member 3-like n=1 Tax=Dermacentor silvarum TaxID=543639 RepID=UPI0021014D77|nr:ATP-binding cassette sub-family C member 3-like [Dermacentor silvarum]
MATCAAEWLISSYHMEILAVFGCRVRALLQAMVFRKATLVSPGAAQPTGYVASLIGVDCMELCNSWYAMPVTLCGTATLPLLFWMLAQRAGVGAALCCAAWVALTLAMPLLSAPLQKRFWGKEIRARDERLKYITDLLQTIRVVKMYAWEDALQQNVLRSREEELKWLLIANTLDGILDSLYSSCSSVLMIILFSTMSIFEPELVLNPALSFSCVSLLYITDLTTNNAAEFFRGISRSSLALNRIAAFCTADESAEQRELFVDSLQKKGTVKLKNCSFTWSNIDKATDDQLQLRDISVDVEPGSLIGIVGFVGSGKSSLLSAILRDMKRVEGTITTSGCMAYVPQLPNVHNMTIRDNILYGKEMRLDIYHQVLQKCQLLSDLSSMPAGDMTEVGEKGTNLSGGQKQRISIARAVYSQSDVYLLDDPLSALDSTVANSIFREVLGPYGILKTKTRIMVCNQAAYLRHMDKIVLVKKGSAQVYNSIEDLLEDPDSPQNFKLVLKKSLAADATNSMDRDRGEENTSSGRITQDESAVSTKSGWELLGALIRYSEWPALAGVSVLAAAAVTSGFQQLWIKAWTDASTADPEAVAISRHMWIGGLVGLCVLDVGFRLAGGALLAATARRLSHSLHRAMLVGVLRSPVSFFDACPRGRLLNRFTSDLDNVDAECFVSGKQSVQGVLFTAAKVAIVATQTPLVVAVTAVLGALASYGITLATRASHTSRFFESVATSRLFQHMTETLDALSSVRAYGVVERFRCHFYRLTDTVIRGYSAYCGCYRFTRTISATGAFMVLLAALLLSIIGSAPPDPSSLGLTMSAAASVPLALMTLCVMTFTTLQMMVSFERCLEYAELEPEADNVTTPENFAKLAGSEISDAWPLRGKLEFRGYSGVYRAGVSPNVLNNITFSVHPMEKVGIVGRTGAGKSSLVLALLRMLTTSQGRILIDDVDISHVPLKRLRSAITVIPQDPSLVRGTLRVNLDPTGSHSDEELWEALHQAHLASMATRHPAGLQMETADGGTNLSVGQRQLVCLARALLRRSKILLLDEATSQMDGDTDKLIQRTLREAFKKCTVLAIAHRIHTVLDYDRILVLEDGRVKEYGTPAALFSDCNSAFSKMATDAGITTSLPVKTGVSTHL